MILAPLTDQQRRFYEEVAKRPARRSYGPIMACAVCGDADFGVRWPGDSCAACAVDPSPMEGPDEIVTPEAVALLEAVLERNAMVRDLVKR